MRFALATALVAMSLAACGHGQTERVGSARDTVVTPRTTRDTTVVKSDTFVKSDTTVKKGQEAVPQDTAK